jgi:hypothetical protein
LESPAEVQTELDELRNRGLAKLLNRHFTDTTHRLAEEKAAADAALKDLEERRARTSEFVPSKGGELNPFDSLYVELQQKKVECRRKEKETLLLYQRYVQKFGSTGLVSAPDLKKKKKSKHAAEAPAPLSMPEVVPSNTNVIPVAEAEGAEPSQSSILPPDVNFQKFYHRQLAGRDATATTTSKDKTDDEEENDNEDGDAVQMGSPSQDDPLVVADQPAVKDEAAQEADTVKIEEPRQEIKDTQAADPTPETVAIPKVETEKHEEKETESPPPSTPAKLDSTVVVPKIDELAPIVTHKEMLDVIHDPQKEIKALEDAVPVGKKPDDVSVTEVSKVSPLRQDSSHSIEQGRPTIVVSTEVPSATTVTDADDDSDLRSIISGLTSINSAVTRQVLDEVESQLATFIKTETENIRKIMDEEDKSYISGMEASSGSNLGAESESTLQAEAMARKMQKILDGFKNDPSVTSDPETNGDGPSAKSGYPQPYETANKNEKWIVLYDAAYQREYYHETVSSRTQWEPPTADPLVEADDRSVFSHADVMPESQRQSRKSRMSSYRKKMRRQRKRRLIVLLLFFLAAVGCTFYWQMRYPDKSLQEVSTLLVENLKDQFEYTFTDRKAREEAERNRQKSAQELEQEMKVREDAERKARIEAERRALEEQKRQQKIAENLRAQEEQHIRELKEKEQAELNALTKALEEEKTREMRLRQESEELRRPWGCNLPLAYILNRRCRKLASLNPMYKETDLVHNFLQ